VDLLRGVEDWATDAAMNAVQAGKAELAIIGAFIPFLALIAAIRLARPGSRWAQRFYREHKMERARVRAQRYDRRYGRFTNLIGGFVASPAVLAADEEAGQEARAEARQEHHEEKSAHA